MSIQPVPPVSSPTTAGQLAARATQNDQALAAWLGELDGRVDDVESRSGTSVAGAVDTFADLADHEGAEDGKAFVVVDEVAMYVRDRSRPTGWVGPVPMQGSATDVAVAALVDSASSTRTTLDQHYLRQADADSVIDARAQSALADSAVLRAAPSPTSDVITATSVQHPLPMLSSHNAFPAICRLPDGTYLAAWRSGTDHASTDGRIVTSRSVDGRDWTSPAVVIGQPDGDSRDPGLAYLDGKVVLTYYGGGANGALRRTRMQTSDDDGQSWSHAQILSFHSNGAGFMSSPVVKVGDAWLAAAYGSPLGDGNGEVRVIRSTDQGATWGPAPGILVADGAVTEPNIIPTGPNSARILWRRDGGQIGRYGTATTTDSGLTWTTPSLAFWGHGNPHMTRLRSGTIVATYKSVEGHSTNQFSYACTRLSRDGGATWGPETTFGYASRKMTYAAAVETGIDGEMLCVWAAETTSADSRIYSTRLTDGGAITRDGGTPSPVTPRHGIAGQQMVLRKATDQAIPTSAWTAVEWDAEEADHWEGFDPANPTQFQVNETGLYAVTFRAGWNNDLPFALGINPIPGAQLLHNSWSSGTVRDGLLSAVVLLTAGTPHEARVHHTSTEARRLMSGNTANRTSLTIAKIKGA